MRTANRTPIMAARAADRALQQYLDARAVGRRIRSMREATGVSQDELAAYIGVSRATIQNIEHGRRAVRPTERVAIARALGTSIALMTLGSNGNGKAAA